MLVARFASPGLKRPVATQENTGWFEVSLCCIITRTKSVLTLVDTDTPDTGKTQQPPHGFQGPHAGREGMLECGGSEHLPDGAQNEESGPHRLVASNLALILAEALPEVRCPGSRSQILEKESPSHARWAEVQSCDEPTIDGYQEGNQYHRS